MALMDRTAGAAVLCLVATLAVGAPAPGRERGKGPARPPDSAEITNIRLAPALAKWLVGPIYQMATAEERAGYLAVATDEEARAFIERFWERRGPHREFPPAGTRFVFDERVAEADVLYRDGHHVGHRTDRGTVYVLYGPPTEIRFEASPTPAGEPVEIWSYPDESPAGLDGGRPRSLYAFRKQAGLTQLFNVPVKRRLPGGER
jgi:GWxTD domain-containing protein